MYIPPYYRNTDHETLLAFANAHPFAVICSNGPEIPLATHLPFIIRKEEEKIILVSHFARANPHAAALRDNDKVLVIFSGADAYISPVHYEKKENVPTWNYIAVHMTGTIRLLHAEVEKEKILLDTILNFDPGYKKQWDELPSTYISGMMKGIVAFEIEVTNLEGKFKLSQNKTAAEQEKISNAPGMPEELAFHMKKNSKANL
jgi:transcriptional regulator